MIGKYIVDFYCSSVKLAIELDGNQHYRNAAFTQDEERVDWLNHNGVCVLRFSNSDVRNNLDDVCSTIDTVVKERFKASAN